MLLKNNEATELGVTNGAEAIVVDWDAFEFLPGRLCLKTLFVELIHPCEDVTLPGLPINVVPIPSMTKSIVCVFNKNVSKKVSRRQVYVLPNFAMTDFASQGRSRPNNVVETRRSLVVYVGTPAGKDAVYRLVIIEYY